MSLNRKSSRVPFEDARKEADSDYRHAWGRNGKAPWGSPLRAAFYQYLPEVPIKPWLGTEWARRYAEQIQQVLDMECWTRDERNRLKALRAKWRRRADGKDVYYNRRGTCGGRLTQREKDADLRLQVPDLRG